MNTFCVLVLAAASAGDGFGYAKPDVGGKRFLRHHLIKEGPPPPGGPINMNAMGGAGAMPGRRFANTRSQLAFIDPEGMKIGWQIAGGTGEKVYVPAQLTVPARHNFAQGFIYRLKLTDIPNRPGIVLYPTIEVAPSTPATDAYLSHNPIPVIFQPEDFDQVIDGGNFVTKVIYLPDPKYQELAISGVETLVSTRLEPGVDPILEADKRGTILLIVRVGAINLEMPQAMPATAPGAITSEPSETLESAPVTPTVPAAPAPAPAPAPAAPVPATPPSPAGTKPKAASNDAPVEAAQPAVAEGTPSEPESLPVPK